MLGSQSCAAASGGMCKILSFGKEKEEDSQLGRKQFASGLLPQLGAGRVATAILLMASEGCVYRLYSALAFFFFVSLRKHHHGGAGYEDEAGCQERWEGSRSLVPGAVWRWRSGRVYWLWGT